MRNAGANAVPTTLNETITTQLEGLAANIEGAILNRVPETNPRRPIFFQRLRELQRFAEGFGEIGPSGRGFLGVAAFTLAFNLDWYAVDTSG